jgi:hypothetical protein
VSRPPRGRQRRTGRGSLAVRFGGTAELRPARERLRASRRALRLRLGRNQPRIRGSRVIVVGRVIPRARKRVRIAVEFNRASGQPAEISARANVNRRGRFRARLSVPPAVRDRGAWVSITHPGRGPLHGQRIGSEAVPHGKASLLTPAKPIGF